MQLKSLLTYVGLATVATAQTMGNSSQTLVQALNSSSQLSSLLALVAGQPDLASSLGAAQNITILAPNNAALAAFLNSSAGMAAGSNSTLVSALLSYHVVMGSYSNFSANATFVPTMLNTPYANVTGGQRVEIMNGTVYSGLGTNSTINGTVQFNGGYIHIINRVLTIPQSVPATAIAYNLTSAYGALNASGLVPAVSTLGNSTFFIPNNAAFRAIGSALPNLTMQQIIGILSYHVVPGRVGYSTRLMNGSVYQTLQGNNITISINGSAVFVNSARVILPNILVSNGVVHVIDAVLNPNNTAVANGTQTAGSPAYSGASSATNEPYTSGQPTPTSAINTGSIVATATGGAGATSSSAGGAWMPKPTGGALGAAALGGLALIMHL